MRFSRTARPARTALTALAAATLLGLASCGASPEAEEEAPPAPIEESDGGGEQNEAGGEQNDADGADDGAEDSVEEEPAGDGDEGDDGAAEDRMRIMFAPEVEDLIDDGDSPAIGAEDLAGLLGEPFGAEASCAGELIMDAGQNQECEGPSNVDAPEESVPWTAHVVPVPAEGELGGEPRPGVLFTSGGELGDGAQEVIAGSSPMTGIGFGSAFGMEDLSAEELADSSLQVLTSDNAYVPVHDSLPDEDAWASVDCSDGMSFEDFEPAECIATSTLGKEWHLTVLPGMFVDNDPGLLIAIGDGS